MTRFVNLYLLVTGITAAIVLAMPWLVILGLFALILPGLILGLAPTAFLWGLGFAIPWYALRPVLGDYVAIAPAVLIAAAVFWLVPQASVLQSKSQLARSVRPEVIPREAIRLAGHVLVDTVSVAVAKPDPLPSYDADEIARRPFVCNALCAALLATPGVESVTVTSHGRDDDRPGPFDGHARTFRVVPKAECPGPSIRPTEPDALGLAPRPRGRNVMRDGLMRPLQAEWDVRLSTRDCIVAEAPRAHHDVIIRIHSYRAFASDKPGRTDWSLDPLAVSVERIDVTNGAGHMLLSKTLARTDALSQPLFITAQGGLENFRFQWARKSLTNGKRYEELKPNQLLADHTSLRTEVDVAAVMRATRDRLSQALADPGLPASDPAFKLSAPWMRSLANRPMSEDDVQLLAKVIRDRRVTDYEGIWDAIRAAKDRASELRAPMIERVAALVPPSDWQLKALGNALGQLPPATFATPTATEQAILADPARRALAPGLISRQSDRGPAAVPQLLELLDYHLRDIARQANEKRPDQSGNMIVVDRVRMALCLLGRDASGALPAIDRLTAEGLVDRRFATSREWHLMLARIGKPIGAIPKPADRSGTEEQFHRNLQSRLDHFRPDRDCGGQWS